MPLDATRRPKKVVCAALDAYGFHSCPIASEGVVNPGCTFCCFDKGEEYATVGNGLPIHVGLVAGNIYTANAHICREV